MPQPSRDAALAIVPPDQVWDTLQRARHYARDKSYEKWPPCLRLFHPFVAPSNRKTTTTISDASDLALAVAYVIDKYQIVPFQVHLTQWSVIPHAEAMEADWKAMQLGTTINDDDEKAERELTDEERRVQRLIAREEQKGRENFERRRRRSQARAKRMNAWGTGAAATVHKAAQLPAEKLDSPKALWEKQKQMYEEFNGPCVVCLEPDDESRERIMELRELLLQERAELAPFASYSPTLTLSDMFPFSNQTHTLEYRPIVPVASFPTVTSAVEMARKLRSLWDPLTFTVTDLQVVSTGAVAGSAMREEMTDDSLESAESAVIPCTSWLHHSTSSDGDRDKQMGCDALIMLAGEELPMDDELNKEMANLIAKEGHVGGYSQRADSPEPSSSTLVERAETLGLDTNDGEIESIQKFLDEEEEEEDEGTVVVIGRTHFFTGEMRTYVGMPATSATDGRDRGVGFGSADASTRRRRGPRSSNSNKKHHYGARQQQQQRGPKRRHGASVPDENNW